MNLAVILGAGGLSQGARMVDYGFGTSGQISRRDMIRKLVSGAGAGTFLAGTAAAHPIYKHLADGTLLAEAAASISAGAWKPAYLNAYQSETLQVLAERIIPNSTKAQVTQFIDLLLSVETVDVQRGFDSSLAAFDQEATRRFGHAFKEISETNQNELLTAASATPAQQPASAQSEEDDESVDPNAVPAGGLHSLYDHFENMKTWVRGAYYSSEIGMRELGWTGMVFHLTYSGCQHPDGHV